MKPDKAEPTESDRRLRHNFRLARLLKFLQLVLGRGQWNPKTLAAELECSDRTLHRMRETLELAGVRSTPKCRDLHRVGDDALNPDNGERTTNLAWVAGLITGLPLAVLVGGFAGWAAGRAAGEWLEYLGATEAAARGGRLGGVLGAVLCAAYVAHRLRQDERSAADAATDRRDTPAP